MQTKTNKKHIFLNWLVAVFLIIVIFISLMWPTNYFIESPGEAVAVGKFVNSQLKRPKNLYLVTVSITKYPASVIELLYSYTDKFASRIPSDELLGNQTNSQYEELQNWYMETSQQNAIYYAAKKAKLKPKLTYQGVYVMAIQKNSSFKHKLQVGDIVISANDHKFKSTEQMMQYLQKQKIGNKIQIKVLRNNQPKVLTGKVVRVTGTNRPGIGIQLVEHIKVTTKPKLSINAKEIGGPSAGLMFALESYEVFTHTNLTRNHKIAGTGTISPNGKVGIIGGVDKKVVAADRAGAEVFFAPSDQTGVKKSETNYEEAKRIAKKIATKMKIVPVNNFDDALTYLKHKY